MKIGRFIRPDVTFIALVLAISMVAANENSTDLSGVYTSEDGVVISITKIDNNRFALSSDHSKKISEAGHNWSGVGMLNDGKLIGLFKYPDHDSKYHGFFGIQDAEIQDNCLIITGSQYKSVHSLEGTLGPFKYCKI